METEELTPPVDPPVPDANYEAFKIEILKAARQLRIRGASSRTPTKIFTNFIDVAARQCARAIIP